MQDEKPGEANTVHHIFCEKHQKKEKKRVQVHFKACCNQGASNNNSNQRIPMKSATIVQSHRHISEIRDTEQNRHGMFRRGPTYDKQI